MYETGGRIVGTEMEWSVRDEERQISHNILQAHINAYCAEQPMVNGGTRSFFRNGAAISVDIEHLEYNTEENDSFEELTASEIAGENISRAVLNTTIPNAIGKLYMPDELYLNKRVLDAKGNSWGYHENYYANIKIDEENLALLGTFMAVRNALFGAGAVLPDGRFVLGQKGSDVHENASRDTTNQEKKAVIDTRDEPLANKFSAMRRVHVVSGDPTMSPWATTVKTGMTSNVLKLKETGLDQEAPELHNLEFAQPLSDVMRAVGNDSTLSAEFPLVDGTSASALDVLQRFNNASKRLSLTPEDERTAEEVDKAIADGRQNPARLTNRADWAAKLFRFLIPYQEKHGLAPDNPRLQQIDLLFDEISVRGLGKKLREEAWSSYMPSESLIKSRVKNLDPPATTRAHLRGQFVDEFSHDIQAWLAWDLVKYKGRPIHLSNPAESRNSQLDDLINKRYVAEDHDLPLAA